MGSPPEQRVSRGGILIVPLLPYLKMDLYEFSNVTSQFLPRDRTTFFLAVLCRNLIWRSIHDQNARNVKPTAPVLPCRYPIGVPQTNPREGSATVRANSEGMRTPILNETELPMHSSTNIWSSRASR